jgi:hypothetical protein
VRGQPVDIAPFEAGVRQGAGGRLVVELERGLLAGAPDVGERGADDRDASRQRSFQSMRFPDSNSFWPSAIESWSVPIAT